MGDVVNLRSDLINNRGFLEDCCRFSEGLLTEKQIVKKYQLDAEMLDRLNSDDALIEAIEVEKARRIRDGSTAREKAQAHFTKAPDILNSIMEDTAASPRHRIESAKELRVVASNVADAATPAMSAERFIIKIVLGPDPGDTLTYPVSDGANRTNKLESSKLIEHDSETDTTSSELTVVADEKRKGGGNEFF
jgi:hypothetical protein